MHDIHRLANLMDSHTRNCFLALPSGIEPVYYVTVQPEVPVEVYLAGGNDDPVTASVMVIIEDERREQSYCYYREIPADGSYKSVEQLEDEMIELFDNVIEAFERGKSMKSIVDYYGFFEQ